MLVYSGMDRGLHERWSGIYPASLVGQTKFQTWLPFGLPGEG